MNREIIFRGKRTNNGEWVEGFYFEDTGGLSVIQIPRTPNTFTVDPETVGQYTGLKDKYNKEIYEGDICWDDEEENYGEVRFLDGGFSYIWQNICVDLFEIDDSIEIVGNIHDNPELLVTE